MNLRRNTVSRLTFADPVVPARELESLVAKPLFRKKTNLECRAYGIAASYTTKTCTLLFALVVGSAALFGAGVPQLTLYPLDQILNRFLISGSDLEASAAYVDKYWVEDTSDRGILVLIAPKEPGANVVTKEMFASTFELLKELYYACYGIPSYSH